MSLEQQALEAAFIQNFNTLFTVLLSSFASGDVIGGLKRFENGLTIQREAYDAVSKLIKEKE